MNARLQRSSIVSISKRVLSVWAAGLVVSLVVAWSCTLWVPTTKSLPSKPHWPRSPPTGWPPTITLYANRVGFGLAIERAIAEVWRGSEALYFVQMDSLTAGWPAPCVSLVALSSSKEGNKQLSSFWEEGIPIPKWAGRPRQFQQNNVRLPVIVIGWGLLVDSAVFAAPIGAIILGVAALKRRRRARLNCCANCGYDLGGICGLCPECGGDPGQLSDTVRPNRSGRVPFS